MGRIREHFTIIRKNVNDLLESLVEHSFQSVEINPIECWLLVMFLISGVFSMLPLRSEGVSYGRNDIRTDKSCLFYNTRLPVN